MLVLGGVRARLSVALTGAVIAGIGADAAAARTIALGDGTMLTRVPAARVASEPGWVDTTLRDGWQANASFSSSSTLFVGQSATSSVTNGRALLRYDVVGQIPAGARIVSAHLELTPVARQNSQAKRVDVHALTRAFTPAATWNRYDGTNPWTTPGGDFAPVPEASAAVRGDEFFNTWNVSGLVAAWHEGRAANHGVLVKDAPGQPRNAISYGSANSSDPPMLAIRWSRQPGDLPAYYFERWELEDGSSARINVANGNLLLSAEDLTGVGPGRTVSWSRHYNTLPTERGSMRDYWRFEYDANLHLGTNHAAFVGPDGATVVFHRTSAGEWVDALDSELTLTSTATEYRVGDPMRKVTWVFNSSGVLDHQLDSEGNQIRRNPLTDTDGFQWLSTWTGETQQINGPAGTARYQYSYVGYQILRTVESNGHSTLYLHPNTGYGPLQEIVVDGTHRTGLQLSPEGRVLGFTRNGAATTFAYHAGRTVMTRPDGSTRTYHYDPRTLRVLRIADGNGPEVSLSGAVWSRRGIPFSDVSDLRVSAASSSTAAGNVRISVSVDEELQGEDTSTPCSGPCTATRDLTVDGGDFVDGPNVVQVEAVDQQGRTTRVDWVVTIDAESGDKVLDEPDVVAEDEFGDGVDDVCEPDPEGLAGYCSADDATNVATQEVLAEADDEESCARALATPAPSLRPGGSGWAIADEKWQTFSHPRFAEFQFRRARKIVPWDAVLLDEARTAGESPYPGQMPCRVLSDGRRQCQYCDNYRRMERTRCRWRGSEQFTVDEIETWLQEADRLNIEPMITFGHSRSSRFFGYLPTRVEYRAAVRAFLQRFSDPYPDADPPDRKHFIPVLAAWNEPNHREQPTARRFDRRYSRNGARRAGLLYRDLMSICHEDSQNQCTVAAGEFLDSARLLVRKNPQSNLKYIEDYIKGMGTKPPFWSLHAYATGFYESAKRLRAYFRATRTRGGGRHAPIWLTEQGGYVQRKNNPDDADLSLQARERRANRHLEYLLGLPELAEVQDQNWNRGRRLTRFYHYQWFGDSRRPELEHDTGLVRDDNDVFALRTPRETVFNSNPPEQGVFLTYRAMACPPSKPGCPS